MPSLRKSLRNKRLEVARRLLHEAKRLYSSGLSTERIILEQANPRDFSNVIIHYYLPTVNFIEPIATAFCLTDSGSKEKSSHFNFVPDERLRNYKRIFLESNDLLINIEKIDMPKRLLAVRKKSNVVTRGVHDYHEPYRPRIYRTSGF